MGPWKVEKSFEHPNKYAITDHLRNNLIADKISDKQMARLIATTPLLLHALKELHKLETETRYENPEAYEVGRREALVYAGEVLRELDREV